MRKFLHLAERVERALFVVLLLALIVNAITAYMVWRALP